MITRQPDDAVGKSSRRLFLWGLWTFITTVLLIFVGAFRFLVPNVEYGRPSKFRAGKPEDYPTESSTFLADEKVYIVRDGNKLLAISAVCTHLGCTVRLDADSREFACPCHVSKFRPDGTNYYGPAPRPLDSFEITSNDLGTLIVDKKGATDRDEGLRV